jgi:DNA-binding beta-propeller fold protein YncE
MKARFRSVVILSLAIVVLLFTSNRLPADTGMCGAAMTTVPFTDVMGNIFFCQIAEAFFSGLTNGTTPTTYSPNDFVPRDQMAAFTTRTQDSALRRGSRRAALGQWATPSSLPITGRTTVGIAPFFVASDGADLWVPGFGSNAVTRVRASDGTVLGTWMIAGTGAYGVMVARGRVYVTGQTNPGHLYRIDPTMPPGVVNSLSSSLGAGPTAIATDGTYVWTANGGSPGSVSQVDPDTGAATTITTGFTQPTGILFDGAYLWVTDLGDNKLKKLDATGNVIQSVSVGAIPLQPVFDGSSIWVPNGSDNSITVVRARDGMALATLTGNGLNHPTQAAFNGQQILVTNNVGNSVSLWKAADLTPIGSVSTGMNTGPNGACSDGINFWITLTGTNQLARL